MLKYLCLLINQENSSRELSRLPRERGVFMPGYLLHLAACRPALLENESFRKGVEAPDLLKKWVSIFGINEAQKKYLSWKEPDMPPSYYFFEERALAKDDYQKKGLHYGYSSDPDLNAFLGMFSENHQNNPFWRGYFWHLITDKIMYSWLNVEEMYKKRVSKLVSADLTTEEVEKLEKKKLHDDWDRTNELVREKFNISMPLPPEIEELNVVKFINDGQPLTYISWDKVELAIELLRALNPLTESVVSLKEWCDITVSMNFFEY